MYISMPTLAYVSLLVERRLAPRLTTLSSAISALYTALPTAKFAELDDEEKASSASNSPIVTDSGRSRAALICCSKNGHHT